MSASVRILVVKTSSLGDVVHALPALSDIARAHPDAKIDWVCEDGFAGIAAMHPAVDRVIPCAIRRWRQSWWSSGTRGEVREFTQALRAEKYDVAIDLQGLVKSAWIMRRVDAVRHGYRWSSAREPFATLAYDVRHRVEWGQHAIVRNRKLAAAAMGYAVEGPVCYALQVPATPRLARPLMVALHSTSRADKLWTEAGWRAVTGRMAERGFDVVLPWGTATERDRSERLAAGVPAAKVPPAMDMQQLAALFGRARIVVGVDTGLVHLAVAAGAPTIAIFGPTDPSLTGVVGERAPAVSIGGNGGMPDTDAVRDAIDAMLDATNPHR